MPSMFANFPMTLIFERIAFLIAKAGWFNLLMAATSYVYAITYGLRLFRATRTDKLSPNSIYVVDQWRLSSVIWAERMANWEIGAVLYLPSVFAFVFFAIICAFNVMSPR
jgi:hypothetical protein